MAKPLVLELEDDFPVQLIGIICPEPNYRMAFLINQATHCYFSRAEKDVEFYDRKTELRSNFALYEFKDEEMMMDWYLVANKFSAKSDAKDGELFTDSGTRKTYLVQDHQQADYFIQTMDDCNPALIGSMVKQLKSISSVITAYTIDAEGLKHKEHLYFLHED